MTVGVLQPLSRVRSGIRTQGGRLCSYEVLHVEEWTDESILENSQAVVRVRRPFARGLQPDSPVFVSDFKKSVERDGRHYLALDRLGLVHLSTGELDMAIGDFTQEMALNPLGRARLADACCIRGSSNHKEKKYDAAIADYGKTIEIGATADGCSCDPFNPLVTLYDGESRQDDKAWEVVHNARKSKRWIAPELLEKLKKDSG